MVLGKDLMSERQQSLIHEGTHFGNWNKIEKTSFHSILE